MSAELGTVAFLGAGAMGETVLAGLLRGGAAAADVIVAERRAERAAEIADRYGVRIGDPADAVAQSATVVLAVKPQDMAGLLAEVGGSLRPGTLVVSLAAGLTTARLQQQLPAGIPVMRVMPNTPALVGQGMAAISPGSHCTEEHLTRTEALLASTGTVVRVPEGYQDAVTAVSGSGPAYLFYVVDAMIEGGVLLGLPRATATELAVQTLVGAAAMLRDTGTHPVLLREQVSSPAGTTIAALRRLDEHGVRAAVLAAMEAARDRSRELSG